MNIDASGTVDVRTDLKSSGGKLYVQIANLVRRRIASGEWLPGIQVPTLERLAAQYGVAVVTVRQALTILEEEGLIWRRQGKGTFVSDLLKERKWVKLGTDPAGMIRLYAATQMRQLLSEDCLHPPRLLPSEGRPAPAYRFMRRVHLSQGIPYASVDVHLDRRVWALAPVRFEREIVIPVMRSLPQLTIVRMRQALTIGTADPQTAQLLDIPLNTPIGELRRVLQDDQGTATYLGHIIYRGDLVMLETDQEIDFRGGGGP